MIDTHAHLGARAFEKDREAVLGRAIDAGATPLVEVGIEPSSSAGALALARAHPSHVVATIGIHPHEASGYEPADVDAMLPLLEGAGVRGVGETGLDYYRDYAPRGRQERLFRRHVEIACERGLPLVIHSRGAEARVLEILEEMDAGRAGGVLHCWAGDADLVPRAIEIGFHLGFGGAVTRSKGRYRRLLPLVPLDRMLLETDSPYLAPAPRTSRRNEPAFLAEVLPVMADMLDVEPDALELALDRNARALFRLPGEGTAGDAGGTAGARDAGA